MNTLRQIGEFLGGQHARLLEMMAAFQTRTGDTADNVATFGEAAVRANIRPGESHALLFGKIGKWFSSLGGLAFRDELEPLVAEYENGEKIVYKGTQAVNLAIPGVGRKVLARCSSPSGEYFHGFYMAKVGERLRMEAALFGLPDPGDCSFYLEKVSYDESGGWSPVTNDPLPAPVKEKPSVIVGDEGFWRWRVDYEDPLTFEGLTTYSDLFFVCAINRSPRLVPLNPWAFTMGYRIKEGAYGVDAYFYPCHVPGDYAAKLQESPTEGLGGVWTDIGNGAACVEKGGVKYIHAHPQAAGFYRVVVERAGDLSVEPPSLRFNVLA